MKKLSKIIVAVLAIAMLSVSFAACGLVEDTEKVEKVKIQRETMLTIGDDITVSGAYYGWYFENAYMMAQSEIMQATENAAGTDALLADSSAELMSDSAVDSAADSAADVAPAELKVDLEKVKQDAIDDIVAVKMACAKAKEAGIELTDADYVNIDNQQKSLRMQLTATFSPNGDVPYSDILLVMNTNIETLNQIIEDEYLASLYYGSLKSEGYITVNHILVKFDDGVHTKDEAQTIANDIKSQIDGGADFIALMNEKSEDGRGADGKLSNTQYTFKKDGSMVAPFEEAAFSLEEGEISDLVINEDESYSGFHIIKRVPVSLADVYAHCSSEEIEAEKANLVKDVKITEGKKISYYSKGRN